MASNYFLQKVVVLQQIVLIVFLAIAAKADVNFQENGGYTAYIQTHNFSLHPIAITTKGYALFIASNKLQPKTKVYVLSPDGILFPDTHDSKQLLTAFEPRGEFSQVGGERLKSAMGGGLMDGDYVFHISLDENTVRETVRVHYTESFLEPSSSVSVLKQKQVSIIKWSAPKEADSFLIFLLPKTFKDFVKDLIPISHSDHRGAKLVLKNSIIPKGDYWVVVRANQHLGHGFLGYLRESWGMSLTTFHF